MIFINPNPTDLRKLLVSLISKMSAIENSKPDESSLTYEEKLESERIKTRTKILQDWKNDEWILPELQEFSNKRARFLDLDIRKANLRNNLLPSFLTQASFSSLFTSSVSHIHFLEKEQEQKAKERDVRGPKKPQNRFKAVANNNKDAWTVNVKKTANAADFGLKLDELVKETEDKEAKTEGKRLFYEHFPY